MEVALAMPDLDASSLFAGRLDNATQEKITALRNVESAVREQGCDTNLCFALQGGDFVSNAEYLAQKNFVDIIIQIVTTGAPANYAGAQYHSGILPISDLTKNRTVYLRKLHRSMRHSGGTNIASGIRFCAKQMRQRRGDANKMVIIGNGFRTRGREQNRAARNFLNLGGALCAVSVGKSPNLPALEKLTRDAGRIVTIDEFFELSEIIVQVVQDVCELEGRSNSPTIL